MGRQIIKQPNGKYAIWSTIVDNFIYIDCSSVDEIVTIMVEEYEQERKKDVEGIVEKLESGEKPYYQFTMNWDEAIDVIKTIHGKREANKMDKQGGLVDEKE